MTEPTDYERGLRDGVEIGRDEKGARWAMRVSCVALLGAAITLGIAVLAS